jgi:hypothetical protein
MSRSDPFLSSTAAALERLRQECDARGHAMLAHLLELARDEAEDEMMLRPEARLREPASNVIPITSNVAPMS